MRGLAELEGGKGGILGYPHRYIPVSGGIRSLGGSILYKAH